MGFKRKQKKNNNKYSKSDKEERKAESLIDDLNNISDEEFSDSSDNESSDNESSDIESSDEEFADKIKNLEEKEFIKKCLSFNSYYDEDNVLGCKFFTRAENIKKHYEFIKFFEDEYKLSVEKDDKEKIVLCLEKIKVYKKKLKIMEDNSKSINFF